MRVALIPGHTRSRGGAYNKTYQLSEYDYNLPVCIELDWQLRKREIDSFVLGRPDIKSNTQSLKILANTLNEIGPDLILEFHCNGAAHPQAEGHEVLVWHKTSKNNRLFASYLDKVIGSVFNNRQRAKEGFKRIKKYERGWPLLYFTSAPTILIEPAFITTDYECKKLLDQRNEYIYIVTEAICNAKDYLFRGA
jgi:N-acetylmuramoyl-L-alanine amidase